MLAGKWQREIHTNMTSVFLQNLPTILASRKRTATKILMLQLSSVENGWKYGSMEGVLR